MLRPSLFIKHSKGVTMSKKWKSGVKNVSGNAKFTIEERWDGYCDIYVGGKHIETIKGNMRDAHRRTLEILDKEKK